MRFDRLELIRWGALEDVSFDLSQGEPGLHVIYGDNEAGKSTTRRAISSLLFGIPPQSADRFRFDYAALRLGGTLRCDGGVVFAFRRRKGRKDTVLDAAEAPISDAPLVRALGGIDRDTFEREWSLDHERLREGGMSLLNGEGELGQSLLAVGLGGIGVGALQAKLEAEAKEIFGKRSSRIVLLLDQVKARRRARDAHAAEVTVVETERATLTRLIDERGAAERGSQALGRELAKIDRVERAHPVLVDLDRIVGDLARFDRVPVVGVDFGKRLVMEQQAHDVARLGLERAEREVAECKRRLAGVVIDPRILACAAAVDASERGLPLHRERLAQVASWHAELERCEKELEASAASVGVDLASLATLALGPYRTLLERSRDLAEQGARVRADRAAALAACMAGETELAKLEAAATQATPAALRPTDDAAAGDALASALDGARRELGGTAAAEKRLEELRKELDRVAAEARTAFEALPRWTRGSLGRRALETARLPTVADIDACAEKLKKVDRRAAEARAAEVAARGEAERCANATLVLSAAEVPTEEAVAAARARRDTGWRLVRASLDGAAPDPVALRSFAGSEPLADAYERAAALADVRVDRLREGASRAATVEAARKARAMSDEQLLGATRALTEVREVEVAAKEEWSALWRPFGIEPGSPRVMRDWLGSAERVRSLFVAEDRARSALETARARVQKELAPLALLLGLGAATDHDLPLILREAEDAVRRSTEARQRRADAERELGRARARVAELRQRDRDAEACEQAWQREWEGFASGLSIGEGKSPSEVVAVFGAVLEVAGYRKQADDVRRRIDAAAQQQDAYLAEVRAATAECGEPVGVDNVATAVRALHDRLLAARAAEQERATEQARLVDAEKRGTDDRERLALADTALLRLCAEAGTDDPQALVRIDVDNQQRRELLARVDAKRRELSMVATDGIEGLRADTSALSALDLGSRRAELEAARAREDAIVKQKSQEIGAVESELAKVAGGAEAAEDESALQGLIASIGVEAADYLRLSFAAQLLRQAAERYRQTNQSPILARTGELLRRLTLGSLAGVVVDEEEAGGGGGERSVIKGLRGAHELVPVEGMSDGVRDQLFLALRLAALEQQLARREPLPFIVDDILIHLSDARARATLDVLAELAGKTQVLLFTHHSRVVELARGLDGRDVFVHAIAR